MSDLRDWLSREREIIAGNGRNALHYGCPQGLVLDEGIEWEPTLRYDIGDWGVPAKPRHCFANALTLAMHWPDELTYVEGYALRTMAVPHAWVVTEAGEMLDPTWSLDPVGDLGDGYLGIPFDLGFVDAYTTRTGVYGVIQDWENDWPLCRAPLGSARPANPVGVLADLGRRARRNDS